MLLNNKWVNNEIKKEIKSYPETNENEHTTTLNPWDTVKAVLREKFVASSQEVRKISNKESNPTHKRTRKQ